jgi:integrase
MPGFLIESLLAGGQSTSLPERDWERLMGKTAEPLNRPKRNLSKTRRWPVDDLILRLMDDVLPQSPASRPMEFRKAAQALQNASMRNDLVPVERYVLKWAAARLDPSIDPRQRRKRFAPSTIRQRASALLSMLRTSFGSHDPWVYNPRDFADALTSGIVSKEGNDTTWNHVACFLDWQNRSLTSFAMVIEDRAVKEAGVPRAQIVTAREYALILDSFDRQKPEGVISRILVILGFRAGLRWPEAINMNIDDMVFTGSCAELHVRDNEGARTKTLAGRRIVPLHCLLEQDELDEVKAWWLNRRIEITATMNGIHRRRDRRLFHKTDDDFQRRLNRDVEHEMKRFTGNKGAVFHDLRHSFGSYLVATLALPFDVPDEELALPIDKSVVSHERRTRVAATLLGKGRLGLNALHAAGALLGHSGERSTLVSYFHLHDWLAGNYVSRPEAMRAIPTQLAATLLGMSDAAAARASSRKRKQKEYGQTVRRKRGRPAQSDHALGTVVLGDFIEKRALASGKPLGSPARHPLLLGNGEPGWEVLASFMCAATPSDRDLIRQHPALTTPYGKDVARELDDILAMTRRGRKGKSSLRFTEIDLIDRRRSVRQLTDNERAVLAKLYDGFRNVDPQVMDLVSHNFLTGYDRVRGYIAVPQLACATMIKALNKAGLSAAEIKVEHRARTNLIRIGTDGRIHRGYVWGILFSCAAHRASESIKSDSKVGTDLSAAEINVQSKSP